MSTVALNGAQVRSADVPPGYRLKLFADTGPGGALIWRDVRGQANISAPYDKVSQVKIVRIG